MRAALSILMNNLFVYDMGLPQDVTLNHHGQPVFLDINSMETSVIIIKLKFAENGVAHQK